MGIEEQNLIGTFKKEKIWKKKKVEGGSKGEYLLKIRVDIGNFEMKYFGVLLADIQNSDDGIGYTGGTLNTNLISGDENRRWWRWTAIQVVDW